MTPAYLQLSTATASKSVQMAPMSRTVVGACFCSAPIQEEEQRHRHSPSWSEPNDIKVCVDICSSTHRPSLHPLHGVCLQEPSPVPVSVSGLRWNQTLRGRFRWGRRVRRLWWEAHTATPHRRPPQSINLFSSKSQIIALYDPSSSHYRKADLRTGSAWFKAAHFMYMNHPQDRFSWTRQRIYICTTLKKKETLTMPVSAELK